MYSQPLSSPNSPMAARHSSSHDVPCEDADRLNRWTDLVHGIRTGEGRGIEQLQAWFGRGVRLLLRHHLGSPSVDDTVHEVILIVFEAIRSGRLSDPRCLVGYIHTVVRNRSAVQAGPLVQKRGDGGLETAGWNREAAGSEHVRTLLTKRTLEEMSARDRDLLMRYYLYNEPAASICSRIGISPRRFLSIKSKVKDLISSRLRTGVAKRANTV